METHRGLLSVQEHREEALIYDVEVVECNATKNQRTPRGSGDQRALFETSQCPLGALLEPSWGTVGAYPFTMSQKEKSSATAEKLGPATACQSRGETLSKQVYLGRF